MNKNERLVALQILCAILNKKTTLALSLAKQPNITSFSKELCFGVCRHYFRLEAIANSLIKEKPKAVELWVCLLMGLYELEFLRTPDFAVVKETVALVDNLKKSWAKGLINAVLRRFCREKSEILTAMRENTAYNLNHPDWLVTRLQNDWPEHWMAILNANDTHPPMTLRVNQQQITVFDYLALLNDAKMPTMPCEYSPQGLTLEKACPVTALPGFEQGLVSLQDQAAQLAAGLLDLHPELRLLDACAAPGGKTCHSLEIENNLECCIALDLDKTRLLRVQENLTRLHLNATLYEADASNSKSWWDGKPFDRILLDAPCSATGVIRRHPDIKLLRTDDEIKAVMEKQKKLLHALWPLLTKGGLLVYATCSVLKSENDQQIEDFLASHPEATVQPIKADWGHATQHGRQILPGQDNMDGFFYSILRHSC